MTITIHLPAIEPQSLEAFRNIYTIKSTQDLFDDIADPEDFPILQTWDNTTSQIQHTISPKERVFQYGNTIETVCVFEKTNWRYGRFGDGIKYGVWYGALEKETSILEALYWVYQNAKEDIARSSKPVVIDRRMLKAQIAADRAIDLRLCADHHTQLTNDNYTFCQELGAYAVENKIDLFLTPSARNPGGTCVPVFSPSAIRSDRTIFYIHFSFSHQGEVQITTDEDQIFKIPASWKSDRSTSKPNPTALDQLRS